MVFVASPQKNDFLEQKVSLSGGFFACFCPFLSSIPLFIEVFALFLPSLSQRKLIGEEVAKTASNNTSQRKRRTTNKTLR
ncbi:MAG: hypothetical protein SOZ18_07695 [Phocaeicola sp.]|nr:hypothetical protein [Phocaeicola sp.]